MVMGMKLYIIGNGFDIHHGLDTRYTSFGLYLKNKYRDTYDLLIEHYGLSDLSTDDKSSMSDPLWWTFEESMSLLDTGSVLEANIDAMPNYASDDFRDRDRYTFQIEMERILGFLTVQLYKAFKEFILAVKFPPLNSDKIVNINLDATYLSFNYTDTLEKYYKIPDEQVLFIHEKATDNGIDDDLILGHGIHPDNFEDEPIEPPLGLTDEDLERWTEYQSDQFDYSFELGKEVINRYFSATFKGTEKIIENNQKFFDQLKDIDEVYVLGHSLSQIDLPYFRKINQFVKPNAKWVATFYDPDDKENHRDTLTELGITNISVVRMENI